MFPITPAPKKQKTEMLAQSSTRMIPSHTNVS